MNRVLDTTPAHSAHSSSLAHRLAQDRWLACMAFLVTVYGAFHLGQVLAMGVPRPILALPMVLGVSCLVCLEELDAQVNGDWPMVRGVLVLLTMALVVVAITALGFYLRGGHRLLQTMGLSF